MMNTSNHLRNERLPLDFSQVDADWLTRTLQTQYPGVVVDALNVVEFIVGHTSKARIEIELNQAGKDAGIPRQLCLKANWSGSPLSSPVCVNEARFYKELASKLPIPAPTCYFADWDDDAQGQQGLLLLEDLVPEGGEFCTSARPIGLDDMARSLEGLARMHGASWGHPELDRQTWLQTAMARETATDDYWSMMEDYFAAHNRIPERVAIFPKLMAGDPNRLRLAFKQQCGQERAYKGPLCLIHGDAHLGNSYRRPNGERVWFDWQIVRKGRPWRDVTYFMIGSITIEDRRKAERDLLQLYLNGLAAQGVKISFEEMWEQYRRMVVWGLVAWQSNINPREETMGPLERFCRAADDLKTHELFRL